MNDLSSYSGQSFALAAKFVREHSGSKASARPRSGFAWAETANREDAE